MSRAPQFQPKPQESKKQEADDDFSELLSIPRTPTALPRLSYPPIDPNSFEDSQPPEIFQPELFQSLDLILEAPYEMVDYQPENPVETPKFFPQSPKMKLLRPEFMEKVDVSTLFYIFYYFPGTSYQFFAANQLKKRDWMFNKIEKTWYHRISEVLQKGEDFEIAKFEVFDHNNAEWMVKKVVTKIEYNNFEI